MIELTEEQQHVLDTEPSPAKVIDPRNQQTYVLLAAEQFERISETVDPGPLMPEERRVILKTVWEKAHWDDPCMDDYDKLKPRGDS